MNVKGHHTTKELQKLYRTQENARLARRIHAVYLASKGLSCPEIMTITGACRRAIQQWVLKYNKHRIDGLREKPRPGQPTKLPRKAELRFNESALHWDLVNTKKKRVSAHLKSGKVVTIYENGQFTY